MICLSSLILQKWLAATLLYDNTSHTLPALNAAMVLRLFYLHKLIIPSRRRFLAPVHIAPATIPRFFRHNFFRSRKVQSFWISRVLALRKMAKVEESRQLHVQLPQAAAARVALVPPVTSGHTSSMDAAIEYMYGYIWIYIDIWIYHWYIIYPTVGSHCKVSMEFFQGFENHCCRHIIDFDMNRSMQKNIKNRCVRFHQPRLNHEYGRTVSIHFDAFLCPLYHLRRIPYTYHRDCESSAECRGLNP